MATKPRKRVRCTKKHFDVACDDMRRGMTMTDSVKSRLAKGPFPSYHTILKYIKRHELRDEYNAAREDQIMMWVDDMVDLAKKEPPIHLGDKLAINAEMQRRRLEIDTMKFISAKLASHIFKERVEVNHTGGGMSINIMDYGVKEETITSAQDAENTASNLRNTEH